MRIAVLASGQGTNFARLLRAAKSGEIGPGEIALLAVDRPCPALDIARKEGLAEYSAVAREVGLAEWERGLLARARECRVDALVLAGFMRILSPAVVSCFPQRILNVHPSLLPAFAGRDAIGQALRYGVRVTGVTVHLVDETLDGGPIVLQEALTVEPGGPEEELAQRIHALEHRLLPQAVRLMAEGRLTVEDRQVKIMEG